MLWRTDSGLPSLWNDGSPQSWTEFEMVSRRISLVKQVPQPADREKIRRVPMTLIRR